METAAQEKAAPAKAAPQPAAQEKAASAKEKVARVLMPARMGDAEAKRHDKVVDAEIGTTVEEILNPDYWAHTANELQAGDHIEVRAEDMSWVAYLIVRYAERNYAHVHLDRVLKLEKDNAAPASSIKNRVEWKGNVHKFCVIRLSDDKILQGEFRTRGEAELWMRNYEAAS